jgi:hypothetical protein
LNLKLRKVHTRYSRRALNYANTIEYKDGKKSKSLCTDIRNGIGSPDTVGFDKYFQEFFWDYLKGRRTPEYISLKKTSIS